MAHLETARRAEVVVLTAGVALQTRIDGFGFEGKYAEDAFVNTMERFATNEAFERLNPEAELAHRETALVAQAALAKTRELLG